jgi:hypothetical protein
VADVPRKWCKRGSRLAKMQINSWYDVSRDRRKTKLTRCLKSERRELVTKAPAIRGQMHRPVWSLLVADTLSN